MARKNPPPLNTVMVRNSVVEFMRNQYDTEGKIEFTTSDLLDGILMMHPDSVLEMPTVQNAIAPLKKTGAIVETGLSTSSTYRAKCWALKEILDRATEPALEKVGAAGPTASEDVTWVETNEINEEPSVSNAIPVQNDRKPRAGTVEHDLMQAMKLIERLEKLAETQAEELRLAVNVENTAMTAILECMKRQEKGFIGSMQIIADHVGKVRAGNEHVESSIGQLLEDLNKADTREAAAHSRGFTQGWREAMKAIREDVQEARSSSSQSESEHNQRIHDAVTRAAGKAKEQVMRDIAELFPGLKISDIVVVEG